MSLQSYAHRSLRPSVGQECNPDNNIRRSRSEGSPCLLSTCERTLPDHLHPTASAEHLDGVLARGCSSCSRAPYSGTAARLCGCAPVGCSLRTGLPWSSCLPATLAGAKLIRNVKHALQLQACRSTLQLCPQVHGQLPCLSSLRHQNPPWHMKTPCCCQRRPSADRRPSQTGLPQALAKTSPLQCRLPAQRHQAQNWPEPALQAAQRLNAHPVSQHGAPRGYVHPGMHHMHA